MACKSVVRDKPFVTSYLCKSTHGKPTYLLHKKKVKTLLWSTYETGLPSYQLKISPIIYNERRFRLYQQHTFLVGSMSIHCNRWVLESIKEEIFRLFIQTKAFLGRVVIFLPFYSCCNKYHQLPVQRLVCFESCGHSSGHSWPHKNASKKFILYRSHN